MSGTLIVRPDGDLLELDFPSRQPVGKLPITDEMVRAPGAQPETMLLVRELHAVFAVAGTVRTLPPNIDAIASISPCTMVVTASGQTDGLAHVCRCIAPAFGIPEDSVTGSIQCTRGPYWPSDWSRMYWPRGS